MTDPAHSPAVSCDCESQGDDRCDYRWLADEVIRLLNPADDDVAEVGILMDAVREITNYVSGLRNWEREPEPDYDDPDWRDQYRFDLGTALRVAREKAPKVTVNGGTWAQWQQRAKRGAQ